MPVWFEEKRISFSSGEKDAPETRVVAMNCSIVYCLEGRWTFSGSAPRSAGRADAENTNRRPQTFRRQDGLIVSPFESVGRFHHRVNTGAGDEAALQGPARRVHANTVNKGLSSEAAAPISSPRARKPGEETQILPGDHRSSVRLRLECREREAREGEIDRHIGLAPALRQEPCFGRLMEHADPRAFRRRV